MRPPKNDRQRQPRRRGFDDDNFFGNTLPPPPSFSGFGSASSAPEAKATVKWYNPEKGFGFVEMADGSGDVFLHANSLQNAGFQAVTPGSILQIRVGQGQKGRQVDQVISVTEGDGPPPSRGGYGGGGGGGYYSGNAYYGSGGGGSALVPTGGSTTSGVNVGNGSISITY